MGFLRASSRKKKSFRRNKRLSKIRSRSNRQLLREYERILFQPLSNTSSSTIPMLPVKESKHQLVKQATYGGYSWNSSRKLSKPQLRSFLQENNVSSTISNPFQKVCGPSKSSIAYPVIYTKDELIRQAISKGHMLDQVSSLNIPKLCDLLDLSGKPIYIKPLEQLNKTLYSPSRVRSNSKSHLIRLAVKYGYPKAMAQRATKQDLYDLLGINQESSKSNALLSTQTNQSVPKNQNVFYEIDDSSNCSLYSAQGETYCNEIKLRSSGSKACEYDGISQVCKSKVNIPTSVTRPKVESNTLTKINQELKETEQKKEILEKIKDQSPPNKQIETEKEIQQLNQKIDQLEYKSEQLHSTLQDQSNKIVPMVSDNKEYTSQTVTTPLYQEKTQSNKIVPMVSDNKEYTTQTVTTPLYQEKTLSNKMIDSDIEERIRTLSPEDPTYKAYLYNKERYFALQNEEKEIQEKIRQNRSDIRADEFSIVPDDVRQFHLSKNVQLNTDLTKKQDEILKISEQMREQLKTMRYLLDNPQSTTSTSLYIPYAIHTRSRLRRSRF
jgi:hypothetical protein